MAEYIDREKLLNELGESASHHAESGREYQLLLRDRNIVREQPTADVIERSEYEKLRLVNLDLAETNKRLLAEHEKLLELRSKIIDEIIDKSFISNIYNDSTIKLADALKIIRNNIGE